MEFIKRMKKREFIEMGLKTLAGLLLAFIAIILMEGMIYSITLNAYKTKGSATLSDTNSIAYIIKDGKNDEGEDTYMILYYYEAVNTSKWSSSADLRYTKDQIVNGSVLDNFDKDNIIWHAPNAFDFTITPVHYVVMVIFVAAIGGYFTYRFIKLAKSYKEVEETYEKTGTIEITNQ